jgi:hypothetical protein
MTPVISWTSSNVKHSVNFFQHQICCFIRRPPILPSVGQVNFFYVGQVNFFQHHISCFIRRLPILPSVGQVKFFQHHISCFVRRPPILSSVGLFLVVLKSHLVLSFLCKWPNDAFPFLLAYIDLNFNYFCVSSFCKVYFIFWVIPRDFDEVQYLIETYFIRTLSRILKRYLKLQQAWRLHHTMWWLLNQPKHFARVTLPYMFCVTDFEKIYL